MAANPLPTAQPARPRAPAALIALDLDTQIQQVEQRLADREAWVRATAGSLVQRAQRAATPKPWVLPAVGVGVVLWLGWRRWHRRDPVRRVIVGVPARVAERPLGALADLPWAGLTASGWPLLPAAWRTRLSPAAAAAVVSTGLAIGRWLFRRRMR